MDIVSKSSGAVDERAVVQAHLQALLASELFAGSPKLSRFLEFTVERTLAGEEHALKEYHLGVTVYGRPPDYDPRVDPIVRVEARRLRAKLKQFYDLSGESPVRIEYATGTYAPVFRWRDQQTPAPMPLPVKRSPGIRRLGLPIGVAATVLSIAAAVIMLRAGQHSSPAPVITKLTADPGLSAWPALSLDGQQVAYASARRSAPEAP